MKKLFLLISVLTLSIVANATKTTISPSSEESDSNIRSALSGSADTIILNTGNYKEADQIHFRRNAVIMAAEGAEVIITPKYYCDLVYENTKVKIIGIKFDGSVSGQQAILASDANTGKELRLENCEFCNFAKDAVGTYDAAYTMDSCIVNNCYFHDNTRSALYFNKSSVEGKQTIYGLKVTNSTFTKIDVTSEYRSVIDVQSYNREATDEIEVVVDHCTFYNNTTMNYDYSAIRTRIVNRTTVSNCIFAHPSAIDFYATNVWAGSVINCLAYNFNNGYSATTKTHANTGNPLFADAENGDFSLAGDFVTSTPSPARYAGTDGSHLGDPRWHSAETFPSTDFEEPYAFIGAKAVVNGSMELDGSSYIHSTTNGGNAIWKVRATKACAVQVTLNMSDATTSGHTYQVEVFDSENNSVGALSEGGWYSNTDDKTLAGSIYLPAADDYKIVLTNSVSGSKATIKGITLTYVGGNVIDIPATLNVNEAWFSSNGTRADGAISYSSIGSGCWAKWNVSLDNAAWYDITVNIRNEYGHNYSVEFFEAGNLTPVASVSEGGTKYGKDATLYPVKLGGLYLPAGDYV